MSSSSTMMRHWKSKRDFLLAQAQVSVILVIAYIGNNWPKSYPRNDNHDPRMFWVMNLILLVAALASVKHEESRKHSNEEQQGHSKIQLLSRPQTEEWKGWMQWAFVMYHYYRVFYVYNEIRVFVSAYVWMTGFGNFLYFDKKQDFSVDRMVSMWLRINYFPLLLSTFLSVDLELYYVVPLHTVGFFITLATCYLASLCKTRLSLSYWGSNVLALLVCTAVHVAFYETSAVEFLKVFSDEYYFRFQADKYSALVGIWSGLIWAKLVSYMQWAYGSPSGDNVLAMWMQRAAGSFLIFLWWFGFGKISDKYIYNPMHPYIFWMPVAGWLMLRNSSKYLTELHCRVLEFLGRITLETYVLQFHVFMCQSVQHIPIVIPNSGAEGPLLLKTANMLLCGVIFLTLAVWARNVTVTTQTSVVDLLSAMRKASRERNDSDVLTENDDEEERDLIKDEENGSGSETEMKSIASKE